jgi:hypothetical protein
MLSSIFILFLVVVLVLWGFAFYRRDPALLALGSIMLFTTGLMLLDTSPDSGIEKTDGFIVNHMGDNNFVVDKNTSFRNAGNDVSLNILGNVFVWGSAAGLMMSLALFLMVRRRHLNE